jgi:hypothetical protein
MPSGRQPKQRPKLHAASAGSASFALFRRIAQLEVDLRKTIQELQALADAKLDGPVSRERLAHAGMLVEALKEALARLGQGEDEDATRFSVGQLEGELIMVERSLGGSRLH